MLKLAITVASVLSLASAQVANIGLLDVIIGANEHLCIGHENSCAVANDGGVNVCQIGKPSVYSWRCDCADGYECAGEHCKACQEVNPCKDQSALCQPFGKCVDNAPPSKGYTCECEDCYHEIKLKGGGRQCVGQNECNDNQCQKGGDLAAACYDTGNGADKEGQCPFWCECSAGFVISADGHSCDEIQACEADKRWEQLTCNHGECIDHEAPSIFAHCKCDLGFECEDRRCQSCKEINPCEDENLCQHGKCVDDAPPSSGYTCACDNCYHQVEIVEGGGFECRGQNECHNNHCQDNGDTGASCYDTENGEDQDGECRFWCECSAGYVPSSDGHACDPVEACKEDNRWTRLDCGDHGTCKGEPAPSFFSHCVCDECYELASASEKQLDVHIEKCVKINYCGDINLCSLGGDAAATCNNEHCKYSCDCSTGFEYVGATCSDINGCESNPCIGEEVCQDKPAPELGYVCLSV